jgi:hypothetical protein
MLPPNPRLFAADWIAAWNSHSLDRILSPYAPSVELISPAAAKLLNDSSGVVTGIDALRDYFAKGLAFFPGLHFEFIEAFAGQNSIVLYYRNQRGNHTAEFMEFNVEGKVTRVVANYSL